MTKPYDFSDRILDLLKADNIGLYEIFWELEEGDIFDSDFNLRKAGNWLELKNEVIHMIIDNKLKIFLVEKGHIINEIADFQKTLDIKSNWMPFDLNNGKGYVLSIG